MTTGVILCYIVIFIFIFIVGACIGSFLNVCIYRLPNDESIIKTNSHCMSCGTPIRKRDLIPIVSWCMLKGRCHSCGERISPRYTLVEALNGLIYVGLFLYYINEPVKAAVLALAFSALIVVFFMDLDTQLINMYVVGFIALMGIAYILFCDRSLEGLKYHVFGSLFVGLPVLLLALLSGERIMGTGDGWLMLAGCLLVGLKGSIIALFVGLLLGSIFGMIHKVRTGDSVFAFGPYLSVGLAVGALWGAQLADLYLSITGLK